MEINAVWIPRTTADLHPVLFQFGFERFVRAALDVEGQMKIEDAEGNGPVDAVFNCIKALVPHEAKLELYQVHAVTEGTDAQAEVSVRLAHEGRSMTSKGADPDTLVASAKAYLGALNKIVMKHQRDMPAQAAG